MLNHVCGCLGKFGELGWGWCTRRWILQSSGKVFLAGRADWVQLWCLWAASWVPPVRARQELLETAGSYLAQSCAQNKMQESLLRFVGGAGVPALLRSA